MRRFVTVVLAVVLLQAGFIAGLLFERTKALGSLTVTSSPVGAEVFVDGVLRAKTPASILVSAGKHDLEVRTSGRSERLVIAMVPGGEVSQHVELRAPGTPAGAQGVVALAVPTPAPPTVGWVSVVMGVEVQLFEGGTLVGSSRTGRIRLAPGRHELDVVIEALALRMRKVVNVMAGRTTRLTFDLPKDLDTNAAPLGGGGGRDQPPAARGTASDRPVETPGALAAKATLYSDRDIDVIPPTIVYPPYLTPATAGPQAQGPLMIEVVVSERGTVESAKALGPPRTMGDVLVLTNELSGSNSWRFRPAVKDGEPVRYRQLVVLNHHRP